MVEELYCRRLVVTIRHARSFSINQMSSARIVIRGHYGIGRVTDISNARFEFRVFRVFRGQTDWSPWILWERLYAATARSVGAGEF
jgi:hypothetical protein